VEQRSLEAIETLDLGEPRLMEHAGGGDDHVGVVAVAAGGLEMPPAASELAAGDLFAEANRPLDVVVPSHALEVRQDLVTRRETVAPFGCEAERVRVQMGGDVARDARIRVLAPCAAEPVGLLVDREVREARLRQLDAAEDARHPRADDDETQ
jgi:hypothetical protein